MAWVWPYPNPGFLIKESTWESIHVILRIILVFYLYVSIPECMYVYDMHAGSHRRAGKEEWQAGMVIETES